MSIQVQASSKVSVSYDEGVVVISSDGDVAISITPRQATFVIEALAKFLYSELK